MTDITDAEVEAAKDAWLTYLNRFVLYSRGASNHPASIVDEGRPDFPVVYGPAEDAQEWNMRNAARAALTAARQAAWQPIETAPKDGSHFLACDAATPYGSCWTFNQRPPTVVHWWGNAGEEGFYTSVNEVAPERPFPATHWMPLPAAPTPRGRSNAKRK